MVEPVLSPGSSNPKTMHNLATVPFLPCWLVVFCLLPKRLLTACEAITSKAVRLGAIGKKNNEKQKRDD